MKGVIAMEAAQPPMQVKSTIMRIEAWRIEGEDGQWYLVFPYTDGMHFVWKETEQAFSSVGGSVINVGVWRLDADGKPESEPLWLEFRPDPGISIRDQILGRLRRTTLRFDRNDEITLITSNANGSDPLEPLDIAALRGIAVVLHDLEHDTRRARFFRNQAQATEPNAYPIDLAGPGAPEIVGAKVNQRSPRTVWVTCAHFHHDEYPTEVMFSVTVPSGIEKGTARIRRLPSGAYDVRTS